MNLDRPFHTVTTAVDGDVLEVLSRADAWFSVSRVHGMLNSRRSTEGIRRVLARLVEQGVVMRSDAAVTPVYQLNRNHLAADAIVSLGSLRTALLGRIRDHVAHWAHPVRYAALFGSGAGSGMRADSDIDLFLVADSTELLWESGAADLVSATQRWTGNAVGLVMYQTDMIQGRASADPVLVSIAHTGLFVVGDPSSFHREIEQGRRGLST